MLKKLEKLSVMLLYAIVLPLTMIVYPHKVIWEDKKASAEIMKKPCVVYSNHTGYSDGLFMQMFLTRYKLYTFIGKDWYEKKGLNYLFRNLFYIPIDRTQMDTSWIDKGRKVVEEGHGIYFFPEGHTSKDGEMLEFQPGFLMLAKTQKLPMVPICIDRKIEPFKPFRLIIGKPQNLDLSEPGRPSQVLKKYAGYCKDSVIELKKNYGNPKFVTNDVRNFVDKKSLNEIDLNNREN